MSDCGDIHDELVAIWSTLVDPMRHDVAREYLRIRHEESGFYPTWASAMKPAMQRYGLYPQDVYEATASGAEEYEEILRAQEIMGNV